MHEKIIEIINKYIKYLQAALVKVSENFADVLFKSRKESRVGTLTKQ